MDSVFMSAVCELMTIISISFICVPCVPKKADVKKRRKKLKKKRATQLEYIFLSDMLRISSSNIFIRWGWQMQLHIRV